MKVVIFLEITIDHREYSNKEKQNEQTMEHRSGRERTTPLPSSRRLFTPFVPLHSINRFLYFDTKVPRGLQRSILRRNTRLRPLRSGTEFRGCKG